MVTSLRQALLLTTPLKIVVSSNKETSFSVFLFTLHVTLLLTTWMWLADWMKTTLSSRKKNSDWPISVYLLSTPSFIIYVSLLTPKEQIVFPIHSIALNGKIFFPCSYSEGGWWIALNPCSANGWNFSFSWKLVFKIRKKKIVVSSALDL